MPAVPQVARLAEFVCSTETQAITAQISTDLDEPAWDDFLAHTPHGHVQQSSVWARSKQVEGWRPVRILLRNAGAMPREISGGFQILARQSRFGRIGYIAKGPALAGNEPALVEACFDNLLLTVKAEGIRALIVQPPDETDLKPNVFPRYGFLPNRLKTVISATLLIDVGCPMADILARMRRTTLLELKRARKRGVTIREGTEQDLGTFFSLMLETCKRQESSPSPASEAALRQVWEAFRPQNRLRLTLAEFGGQPIAGAICLLFGNRVSFWKKGWSGAHRDKHPNQMVMFDAIEWSQKNGFKLFDCLGMTRGTAESLLAGKELTEEQKHERDFFLLGYGGRPVLLPESWIYIPNQLARFAYKTAFTYPCFRPLTQRLIRTIG